ncbi:MAG: chemotaxis protein CheW [Bdellovibrionales bacterium]|nr:chemotaxis protein CheW [Bdellovibrionales bacterium]
MDEKLLCIHANAISYGISIDLVQEILALPKVEPYPGMPPHVRGGLNYRNKVRPLVDLRVALGQQSLLDERKALAETLLQREREHVEWLDELQASVKEKREFRKATDPRKCAFGQWFYSVQMYDPNLRRMLDAFEAPHSRIHALAAEVLSAADSGDADKALSLIEGARSGTLSTLLRLFGELRSALIHQQREVGVIIRAGGREIAIATDDVRDVRLRSEGSKRTHTVEGQHPLIAAPLSFEDGTVVFELNVECLLSLAGALDSEVSASAPLS